MDVIVEDGDDFVASRNGQGSSGQEVYLNIANNEGIRFAYSNFFFQTNTPSTIWRSKNSELIVERLRIKFSKFKFDRGKTNNADQQIDNR